MVRVVKVVMAVRVVMRVVAMVKTIVVVVFLFVVEMVDVLTVVEQMVVVMVVVTVVEQLHRLNPTRMHTLFSFVLEYQGTTSIKALSKFIFKNYFLFFNLKNKDRKSVV